ncbi:MAG TPA: hypothetical protein VK035_01970 [Kiloniellales bacterium]|nr:hypothetical protein [Kiloniellales bacterium]
MEANVSAVLFLLSALGALILFYVLWRDFAIDRAREQLFAQRDALFDLALEGKLSFEEATYQDLRAFLNSLIRGVHRISLFWALFHLQRYRADGRRSIREMARSIPDAKARKQVERIVSRSASIIYRRLIITSLIAMTLYVTLYLLGKLGNKHARGWAKSARTRTLSGVEQEASILA